MMGIRIRKREKENTQTQLQQKGHITPGERRSSERGERETHKNPLPSMVKKGEHKQDGRPVELEGGQCKHGRKAKELVS